MPQITVNLLPDAVKPAKRAGRMSLQLPGGQQLKRIGLWAGSIVLVAAAGIGAVGMIRHHAETRLRHEWDALSDQRLRLAQLQAEQARLETRFNVLSKLVEASPVWSQRLNRLSDLAPDGVWFLRLTIDSPDKLLLEGSALERSGDGMQSVSQCLSALQGEQTFTSVFRQLTLQSVKTRTLGSTEVLDFAILCARDVPAPAKDAPKGKH